VRSTGSLKSRIGLMLMADRPFGWLPCVAVGRSPYRRAPAGQV